MGRQLFRILIVINIFVFVTETSNYSYRFNVYPVDECPNNRTEFETAAKRRNCTRNTRYLCAPDKYLTSLIEFCTDQKISLYEKDNCIKLEGTGYLNHYECADKFISGCPTMPFIDEDIYDYPACISINKDRRCFVAEKDCHERHSATTAGNGNRPRRENGGNIINLDSINKTTFLIVVIFLLVMLILLGLTSFIFYKRGRKEKEKPSGAHLSQRCLSHFEETPERRKFIGYTIDNCIGRMENPLYRERNSRIKFAKLSYYLAEHFPHEKLQELKYLLEGSGKVKNMTSLQSAKSALECFTILQREKLFGPNDVIFMQFLCSETNCKELYKKCIEYALSENALCYFESPPDKGRKKVEFHIKGELKDYSREEIKSIVDVVADILDCKVEEIRVSGVRPSTSFYLVLSIKENDAQKLSYMNEEDVLRLTKFNIDILIVDENTITINSENGAHISPVPKTEDMEKRIRLNLGTESNIAKEAKRQCKPLLMKGAGEEKEERTRFKEELEEKHLNPKNTVHKGVGTKL